jgi:hypothetical protein
MQTAGLSGLLKIAHSNSSVRCIHLSPAGLPSGMPGIGELIEGYMQQAPHCVRHFIERILMMWDVKCEM